MDLRLTTSPQQSKSFTTPATASFTSQTPAVTSPKPSTAPARPTTSSFFGLPRNASIPLSGFDEDLSRIDPDDLFRRFTVAQVKSLAVKFRAEADAKQEELRLMVGERYRDLLQASTSIIDMASSSQHVAKALQHMSGICSEQTLQKPPPVTRSGSENGKDLSVALEARLTLVDSQLKTLQTLAAHLKLLLDCPEHFWRLMERKKYLDAAWLFTVARMVHRSLLEDEDEDIWASQGIDVLEQFPLVQRQWDAISSFKAQISHKATQALRQEMNVEETLDAIISLVLLDSLSLGDTLSIYLSQRGKAVQTFFSSSHLYSKRLNHSKTFSGSQGVDKGRDIEATVDGKRKHRDARQALYHAIDLLSDTIHTARTIYARESSGLSLIEARLTRMQTEGNVELSTERVLSGLPSASLLALYLPPSIKSYTPYINSSATSFQLPDSFLSAQLGKWFHHNVDGLAMKIKEWIEPLDTAAEVDRVRSTSAKTSLLQSLRKDEESYLVACIDQECGRRIIELWKDAFITLSREFEASLSNAVKMIRTVDPSAKPDLDPVESLLSHSLPYPPFNRSNITQSSIDIHFSKFDASLRQRRTNRTSLLDGVVSNMEKRTNDLKNDLDSIASSEDSTKAALSDQFVALGNQLCSELVTYLQRELAIVTNVNDDRSTNVAVFIGRVAITLSVSSSFINNLSQNSSSGKDFSASMAQIHDHTISLWQARTVKKIMQPMRATFKPATNIQSSKIAEIPISTRPSTGLLDALTLLTSSIFRLGLSRSQLEAKGVVTSALKQLVTDCLSLVDVDSLVVGKPTSQLVWDVIFLEEICQDAALDVSFQQIRESLSDRLEHLVGSKNAQRALSKTREAVLEDIPRVQVMLSPLFQNERVAETVNDSASSSLLIRGTPSTEASPSPTIDLAQPSPRFGLLLVSRSTRTTNR